jgi:hypothetical protein
MVFFKNVFRSKCVTTITLNGREGLYKIFVLERGPKHFLISLQICKKDKTVSVLFKVLKVVNNVSLKTPRMFSTYLEDFWEDIITRHNCQRRFPESRPDLLKTLVGRLNN